MPYTMQRCRKPVLAWGLHMFSDSTHDIDVVAWLATFGILLCLGAAQQSLDEALQWARDREAFGRPIGRYQGVSFPLAELSTYVRGARHVCYEALWRKDNELEHSAEAAMAKFWAPKLAVDTIHQCLLTLGHVGYSTEHRVGQRLRDVIGLEIGDGTAQVAKLVIARNLLGRAYAP